MHELELPLPSVDEFLSYQETIPSPEQIDAVSDGFQTGTQTLRALQAWWDKNTEDRKGSRLLEEFVRKFAEYERSVY